MAEYLVIRLAEDHDDAASWIAVDDNGTRVSAPNSGPLESAAREVGAREVIVLVPSTRVVTTLVDIPVKRGPRLLAALPYALEEQLADDVENLHFAAGTRYEDGRLPVAVIAREQMLGWLAALEAAGISPARVVPENHGLARIPGTMSLLAAEGKVMFNDGGAEEFVLQDIRPSEALALAGALDEASPDDPDKPAHLLVYCEPADEQRFEQDWTDLRQKLAGVDVHLLTDGVLPRLAVTVASGRGINLLQGRFAVRSDAGAMFRPWRLAAILLVTLGAIGIASKGVDYYRLGQEEAALKAQFTEIYREIRPQDTREIIDPVATVNSVRRSFGSPVAVQVFLPSLQQLGQAIQQNTGAEIEAISYRAGVIDVRLSAPDVATLDSIQKIVSSSGRFSASIQSTDQVGDKVSSRIQIRETGA
jgi:general secretion pathway protein L